MYGYPPELSFAPHSSTCYSPKVSGFRPNLPFLCYIVIESRGNDEENIIGSCSAELGYLCDYWSALFIYAGDFFFRALAPIFGLAAGGFRFLTAMVTKAFAPSLYEDSKKKE